jgi:hypothetical protein
MFVVFAVGLILLDWLTLPVFATDDCHIVPAGEDTFACTSRGGKCRLEGGTCDFRRPVTSDRVITCECDTLIAGVEVQVPRPVSIDEDTNNCEEGVSEALASLAADQMECLDSCQRRGRRGTEIDCDLNTNSRVRSCIDRAVAKAHDQIDRSCPEGQPICQGSRLLTQTQNAMNALNWAVYCAE